MNLQNALFLGVIFDRCRKLLILARVKFPFAQSSRFGFKFPFAYFSRFGFKFYFAYFSRFGFKFPFSPISRFGFKFPFAQNSRFKFPFAQNSRFGFYDMLLGLSAAFILTSRSISRFGIAAASIILLAELFLQNGIFLGIAVISSFAC